MWIVHACENTQCMSTHIHKYSTFIVLTGSEWSSSSSSSSSRGHRTSNRRTWCSLRMRWTSHCSRWRAYSYPVNWNIVWSVKPNCRVQNTCKVHVVEPLNNLDTFKLVQGAAFIASSYQNTECSWLQYSIFVEKNFCDWRHPMKIQLQQGWLGLESLHTMHSEYIIV